MVEVVNVLGIYDAVKYGTIRLLKKILYSFERKLSFGSSSLLVFVFTFAVHTVTQV